MRGIGGNGKEGRGVEESMKRTLELRGKVQEKGKGSKDDFPPNMERILEEVQVRRGR